MKICRFDRDKFGLVREGMVHEVTNALNDLPSQTYPYPLGDVFINHFDRLRPLMERIADSTSGISLESVALDAPVANPSKIFCAPINYQAHIDEVMIDDDFKGQQHISHISNAGLFLKATSALVGPSAGVTVAFPDRRNDHEVELVAVIGRIAKNVKQSDALDIVAGYAVGLDMTVRGTEDRSFRKSADSYAVLGPWMVSADKIADPGRLDLSLKVNGQLRQSANTSKLTFGLPKLIELASSIYTLYPGDLLYSGTPEGVGPVNRGDVITAEIELVGAMDVVVH